MNSDILNSINKVLKGDEALKFEVEMDNETLVKLALTIIVSGIIVSLFGKLIK